FLKSKTTDPAVLVIDEAGRFVISLLSGHIGGANRLANQAAAALGATPVITTATDVNGKFAVDVFAKDNGLRIGSMAAAKEISAAILRGEKIGVVCEGKMEGEMPPELILIETIPREDPAGEYSTQSEGCHPAKEIRILHDITAVQLGAIITIGASFRELTFSLNRCDAGSAEAEPVIWVSQLPPVILELYPKSYIIGIGCRKGKSVWEIARVVNQALCELGITMEEIAGVASIDLKKNEPGLVEFCRRNALCFETYPAETLATVKGDFSPSAFVQSVTGVDNVCERAALCMAKKMSAHANTDLEKGGGRLIMGKQAEDGVTVAVAERSWKVRF
ncbi:MAG: cobalamin biosynthesis protein, partial [Lachnospiraceae bacterium]|nr:cobalamin biosynthesis protein [Lachnospiraceae bacterium]